jgi:hypothetical protein
MALFPSKRKAIQQVPDAPHQTPAERAMVRK